MVELKPFDIVAVAGLWYMPHHWLIKWSSHHRWVHNAVVLDDAGEILNPIFTGMETDKLGKYQGREVAICRYRGEIDEQRLSAWLTKTAAESKGYDFISWLGFFTGLKQLTDPQRWACSEVPYWLFQENGNRLTNLDEPFPYPSLPVFNPEFEIVWRGILA